MKRSPLKRTAMKPRSTPMKRSAKAERTRLFGIEQGHRRRAAAGIPDLDIRDERGARCVEKACATCGEMFLVPWMDRIVRKTCSHKCAAIRKRERGGADRVGATNPNFRHGGRSGVSNRAGERRWYAALGTTCEHPGCPREFSKMQRHHIIYEQHVRGAAGDKWDPRNGITICISCHTSHHRRGSRVIPLSALSDAAFEFAAELLGSGAAYEYLRRRYSGGDARLDALDAAWQRERQTTNTEGRT